MSNESVYLPGKIRDRIQDLMKSRKITQAELATRIGCSESSLSRFISGKTDKLGDENIHPYCPCVQCLHRLPAW